MVLKNNDITLSTAICPRFDLPQNHQRPRNSTALASILAIGLCGLTATPVMGDTITAPDNVADGAVVTTTNGDSLTTTDDLMNVNGAGTLTFDGSATVTVDSDDNDAFDEFRVSNNRTVDISNGIVTVIADETIVRGTLVVGADGTIVTDVVHITDGDANIDGAVTGNVDNDDTLLLAGTVSGTLTNDDSLTVDGVSVVTGTVTNESNGTLDIDLLGSLTANAGVQNDGDLNVTGLLAGNVENDDTFNVVGTGTLTGNLDNDADADLDGTMTGNITNDGTLDLAGVLTGDLANNGTGTVTVDGTVTGIGILTQSSTGAITINDGFTLNATTINNTGSGGISVGVGSTLNGTGNTLNNSSAITVANNGSVTDAGDINNNAGGSFTFANDGTMTAGGAINNLADGAITFGNDGTMTAVGMINNDATGGITFGTNGNMSADGAISNTGNGFITFTDGGTMAADADMAGGEGITNAGAININGGTVTASTGAAGFNNTTGTITVASGAELDTALTNAALGTLDIDGTLTGALTNAGSTDLDGTITGAVGNTGTLNMVGTITGNVANTGTLTLEGTLTGDLDNTVAGNVSTTGDIDGILTLTQNSSVALAISDGHTLEAATIDVVAGSGGISVGVASTLHGTGNTLNNNATINVATGGSVTDAGAINNNAGGVINFADGGTLTADTDSAGDEGITNAGVINIDGGTVAASTGGAGLFNNTTGSIVIDSGAELSGDLTNSNAVVASLKIDGSLTGNLDNDGHTDLDGTITGTVDNSGILDMDGTIDGNVNNTGTVTMDGDVTGNFVNTLTGTADINDAAPPGTIEVGGFVDNAGTLSFNGDVTGVFTNSGAVTFDGVSTTVGGLITNQAGAPGGTMLVSSALTANGGLQNNSTNGVNALDLDATLTGNLVNNGNADIDATIDGNVDNAGAITVDGDVTGYFTNTVAGTANINTLLAPGLVAITGPVNNAGVMTFGGLTTTVTGLINNQAGGTMDVNSALIANGDLQNNSAAGLDALDLNATLTGNLINNGNADIDAMIDGNVDNSGIIAVDGEVTGNFTNLAGGIADINALAAPLTNEVGGSVDNAGTMTFAGDVGGTFVNSGGVTIDGVSTVAFLTTNQATGTMLVSSALTANGGLQNDSTNGTNALDLDAVLIGNLDNNGNADVDANIGGNVDNDGNLLLAANVLGTLSNGVSVTVDGASTVTGAVTNEAAGTLGVDAGITFGFASLVNDGIVNTGVGSTLGGGLVTNNLTMNVANGTNVTTGFTNAASGTVNVADNAGFQGAFTSAGTINMVGGTTDGHVIVTGPATLGGTTFQMDADLSGTTGLADKFTVTGVATGNVDVEFTNTGGSQGVTAAIEILSFGAGSSVTATATNLPLGGSFIYSFTQVGNSWYLGGGLNPSVAGVFSGVALTQTLVGSVVNRPSSPFVTGLAVQDENDPCGPGAWARAVGGQANVTGSFGTDALGSHEGRVSANYRGLQAGADFSCFGGFYSGWDLSFGAIAGANQGNTSQPVFQFNPGTAQFDYNTINSINNTTFNQGYVGAYMTAAKGDIQGDIQLRYEYTDFAIAETATGGPVLGLDTQNFNSQAITLSGSLSKVFRLNEEKGIVFVPVAGFSYSNISTGDVTFGQVPPVLTANPGVLQIANSQVAVGYVGATIARTQILPDQRSALTYFATATVYNDFAPDARSVFVPDAGINEEAFSGNLGTYGEVSLGLNYTRILGQSGSSAAAKQLNASFRVDGRLGASINSWGVTGQFRIQF